MRRHSRGEAEIQERLAKLDPNSERYKILASARMFKASWVQLGELLTTVREHHGFTHWGYASFEAYCRRELRIKVDTANKLTRSFAFLRDHEPAVLASRDTESLPPLDVVDLLSQAHERTKMSDDDFAAIKAQALQPQADVTRDMVMKRLRQADPEAFKPVAKVVEAPKDNDLRKALLLAERLESLLGSQPQEIGQPLLAPVAQVVRALRERMADAMRKPAA